MKQRSLIAALSLALTLLLLSGCGSSGEETMASEPSTSAATAEEDTVSYDSSDETDDGAVWESAAAAPQAAADSAVYANTKLILTAEIYAETKDYVSANASVETLTRQLGGYLEASAVSGMEGSRSANYTVRVPQAGFESFLTAFGDACHITDLDRSAQDVGQEYYDAEAHVATLKTKHERLLALLAKSEKMEDIIELENALSECEYELEKYQGTLRKYDDLVGFSTIHIQLYEVPDLSAVPAGSGFLSELQTAASSGLHGFTMLIRTMIIGLISIWPLLLILLIALICFLHVLRKRHASAQPPENQKDKKDL